MATPQQSRLIFVNLAVEDLGRAADFFTQLGFTFDALHGRGGDLHGPNDQAFVMLLTRNRFQDFTKREVLSMDPAQLEQ